MFYLFLFIIKKLKKNLKKKEIYLGDIIINFNKIKKKNKKNLKRT